MKCAGDLLGMRSLGLMCVEFEQQIYRRGQGNTEIVLVNMSPELLATQFMERIFLQHNLRHFILMERGNVWVSGVHNIVYCKV